MLGSISHKRIQSSMNPARKVSSTLQKVCCSSRVGVALPKVGLTFKGDLYSQLLAPFVPPCLLDGKPEDWEAFLETLGPQWDFAHMSFLGQSVRFSGLSISIHYLPFCSFAQRRGPMIVHARAGGIASHPDEVGKNRARVDISRNFFSRLFSIRAGGELSGS